MKKRKRSVWEILCMLGIPHACLVFILGILFCYMYLGMGKTGGKAATTNTYMSWVTAATGISWILVVIKNLIWLGESKKIGFLTFLDPYRPEETGISARKREAQNPDIPEKYLSPVPDGLVLGKKGNNYLRVVLKKGNILNAIIMGSAGTGKSALLLTTLLYQFHKQKERYELGSVREPEMTVFALDIKPELARKSILIRGNPKVRVMNPEDRGGYGWDPYYNLNPKSSDDDIVSELNLIARALIDAGKAEKNEFFYHSARTIFVSILFFTYKEGQSFMQGLRYLTDGRLSDVVSNTLDHIGENDKYSRVKRLLAPYTGKDDAEAFQSIELTMREKLEIFEKDDIKFFLDNNPRKTSANDLENRISVFFSIPETKIDEYQCLLRLVTMQIMHHCSGRPESSHMITLLIDEAARLGSINWTSFLSTSRSRQVATILAFQSLSQMEKVWGKEDAKSMIELCRIIAVLSCTDPDTARMLSDWTGEYKERKKSSNMGGKNDGTYSLSYEDKKILQPSDILDLQEREEVILFVKGQYMRVNAVSARYYNNPELNEISLKCLAENDANK